MAGATALPVTLPPLGADRLAELHGWLAEVGGRVDAVLAEVLAELSDVPELAAALRHAVLGGGKRVRPALVETGFVLGGGEAADLGRAAWVGAAVEMTHAYSLIQDDLPCMDNDVLRRGLPTVHVAFGEAQAILASDVLQTGAFAVLARPEIHPEAAVRLALVTELAAAAGGKGLIGGQWWDVCWEQQRVAVDLPQIEAMQARKTGALLVASLVLGGRLAGADAGRLAELAAFGARLGAAYQVWDDVLDVLGDSATLGKSVGKDAAAEKRTVVQQLGVTAATARATEAARVAQVMAGGWLGEGGAVAVVAQRMHDLATFVVTRQH